MQTITATKKITRGHAPLRWKTGFEPGVSTDIPAVAFGVVRMEAQVEPVDAQTASMRHAWSSNTARADIAMLIDSTVTRVIGGSAVAIGHSSGSLPP